MFYFFKKLYTQVAPSFVLNRQKRKIFRNRLKSELLKPDMTKMTLGVSYSIWDTEELLEASLKSVRSEVDYINVVWQKYSWFGKKCHPGLLNLLKDLKKKGLIDEIIFFPHKGETMSPPRVERRKRNIGLEAAKKAGCNYFLVMDADEFYDKDHFRRAKEIIVERGITHTACSMFSYWKKPEYRRLNPDRFAVPFICKIGEKSKLIRNTHFPCFADGTREMNITKQTKFLYLNCIWMEHMSLVRKDIKEKFKNASTSMAVDEILLQYKSLNDKTLEKEGFIKVSNKFKIKIGK